MLTELYDLIKAIANNKPIGKNDSTCNLAAKITEEVDSESGKLEALNDPTIDKDSLVEAVLLDTFNKLPPVERVKILKEAFLAKKLATKPKTRLGKPEIFEKMEIVKLRTWLVKYVVIFLMTTSIFVMGIIFYVSTKKLISPDPSVLGNILSTMADVLKLLFLPTK